MFSFLKKKEEFVQSVKEDTNKKDIEDLNSFFQKEMDKLLKFSELKEELDDEKQKLLSKRDKLFNSGFINSNIVKEIDSELVRIKNINEYKIQLNEAIDYFTKKYPSYKLISGEVIDNLCKDYGFVSKTIDEYTGDVPDKVLTDIANLKINEEDCAYKEKIDCKVDSMGTIVSTYLFLSKQKYQEIIKDIPKRIEFFKDRNYSFFGDVVLSYCKSNLEIVTGKSNSLILQPIIFGEYLKFYLVVSEF